MKRQKLLKHLRNRDCELLGEGSGHAWWRNPDLDRRSAAPRHTEIENLLARKIRQDLGVEPPR